MEVLSKLENGSHARIWVDALFTIAVSENMLLQTHLVPIILIWVGFCYILEQAKWESLKRSIGY